MLPSREICCHAAQIVRAPQVILITNQIDNSSSAVQFCPRPEFALLELCLNFDDRDRKENIPVQTFIHSSKDFVAVTAPNVLLAAQLRVVCC